MDKGMKCTLSKFVDSTSPTHVVDPTEGWDVTQRELDKLEKWVHRNIMKFAKTKCKVVHQSQDNCCYQCRLGDGQIRSSPVKKDLGVLVDERLDVTQQCVLEAHKCTWMVYLRYIQSSTVTGFCSSLVRSHLECCIQLWGPQHRKDINHLEQV
ncbi:hypothetical protein TURU_091612 [Turdus rufiventris]|nr:hypothetical protein TURU_091612 [Turdus rufiventris]